jgi:aspartyl protease family protein
MEIKHRNIVFPILITCLLFAFTSCGKTDKKDGVESPQIGTESAPPVKTDTIERRIAIKMDSIAGIYQVPCYVNGVKMNFIFDTGATNVCISLTEALFLSKNGYLDKEDIIGKSQMIIADGSLVDNTEINLHSIDVAGILLTDVKATVVSSLNAPLLLGQTALKRLGKIEIEGDSLFITPKDGMILQNITETKESAYNPPEFKQVEGNWYDKPLAFFGYEGKINDYLEAAWTVNQNNMPEQAIAYCNEALKLKKTFQAYAIKGLVYNQQYEEIDDGSSKGYDYRDKAFKCLKRYLEMNEDKENFALKEDSFYYNAIAVSLTWLYIAKDSIDRGLELGQQIYQRNPKSIRAMDVISWAYTKQGNYSMAEKWARTLLDSKLDNSGAYFRLAYLANEQKRFKEAVRYYEKCLEIYSKEEAVLGNLGNIYYYDLDNEDYGIYLWKKAAKLGNKRAQHQLEKNGVEW